MATAKSTTDSPPVTLTPNHPLLADESMSGFRIYLIIRPLPSSNGCIPIMVNCCMGRMGMAIIKGAERHGVFVVPVSFSGQRSYENDIVEINGKNFFVQGPTNRERILRCLLHVYPKLIAVDFSESSAVNANAELYCKFGVPFVMGTTGGDRDLLANTIRGSQVYAFVSLQMAKPIESIRDPTQQQEIKEIEAYLDCHDLYEYELISPNQIAQIKSGMLIKGRSMFHSTIEAVKFLASKVEAMDDKRVYNMKDLLKEVNDVPSAQWSTASD